MLLLGVQEERVNYMNMLEWHKFFNSILKKWKNIMNNFDLFSKFELCMSITSNYDKELSKNLIASLYSFSWYKEFPFINHELKPFNEDSSRDLSKHLIASLYNFFLYNDIPAIPLIYWSEAFWHNQDNIPKGR